MADEEYDWDLLDRSKRIFLAINQGVAKDDYDFEEDSDRAIWDEIEADVKEIWAQGGAPEWPSEMPDITWAPEDFAPLNSDIKE